MRNVYIILFTSGGRRRGTWPCSYCDLPIGSTADIFAYTSRATATTIISTVSSISTNSTAGLSNSSFPVALLKCRELILRRAIYRIVMGTFSLWRRFLAIDSRIIRG